MNKVVRLPSGRFITKVLRESDPAALAKAGPEEIWTTADGCRLLIRDMETTHIMNVLKQLYERAHNKLKEARLTTITGNLSELIESGPEHMERVNKAALDMFPQYRLMLEEMEIRLGKRQREEPTTTRKFRL